MRIGFVIAVLALVWSSPVFGGDYIIGDGDVLRVSVWGVPELSVDVKVRPDGKITLPASGDVVASGKTPEELGRHIRDLLGRFVKEPVVSLTVVEMINNKIYIAGGGVPPRVMNLPGRTTLFKVLCQIDNLAQADLNAAYVIREGKRLHANFDALLNRGALDQDLPLEADDILYIPSNDRSKIYVVGAVKTPLVMPYRDNLKVLDAILAAGGFGDYAKENDVTVVRENGAKIRVKVRNIIQGKDLEQNIDLRPGDYVFVEDGFF